MEKAEGGSVFNDMNEFITLINEREQLNSANDVDNIELGRSRANTALFDADKKSDTTKAAALGSVPSTVPPPPDSGVPTKRSSSLPSAKKTRGDNEKRVPLPQRFNKEGLLQWVLENHPNAGNASLEIVRELFKGTSKATVDWFFHPMISGIVPISEELRQVFFFLFFLLTSDLSFFRGAISYSIMEIEKLIRGMTEIDAGYLIDVHPERFSYVVSLKMRLSQSSRFLVPQQIAEIKWDYTNSKHELVAEILAPLKKVSHFDQKVWSVKRKSLPAYMLEGEGPDEISEIDRLLFGTT